MPQLQAVKSKPSNKAGARQQTQPLAAPVPEHERWMELQRGIGNQATSRLLRWAVPLAPPAAGAPTGSVPIATAGISRISGPSRLLQRKCACGASAWSLGNECDECRTRRQGLQTKLRISAPRDVYEREADRVAEQVMANPARPDVSRAPPSIQRLSAAPNGSMHAAPASVDRVLASPGRPLEPALRRDMEGRFGYDFSRVRVHSDALSARSAREVDARAYTIGHDIVFGATEFAPKTAEGRRLLAHEMVHVAQQAQGVPAVQRTPRRSHKNPEEETGLTPEQQAAVDESLDWLLETRITEPSEIVTRAEKLQAFFERADTSPDGRVGTAQALLHLRDILKKREREAVRDTDGALLYEPLAGAPHPWTDDRPHNVEEIPPFDPDTTEQWRRVAASAQQPRAPTAARRTEAPRAEQTPPPRQNALVLKFSKQEGMTFQTPDGQRLIVWTVIRLTRSQYSNLQISRAVDKLGTPKWFAPTDQSLAGWQQNIEDAKVGDEIAIALSPGFIRDVDSALDWVPDRREEQLNAVIEGTVNASGGVILGIGVFGLGVTALTGGATAGLFLGAADAAAVGAGAEYFAINVEGEIVSGATTRLGTFLYGTYLNAPTIAGNIAYKVSLGLTAYGVFSHAHEIWARGGRGNISDLERLPDEIAPWAFGYELRTSFAPGGYEEPTPSNAPRTTGGQEAEVEAAISSAPAKSPIPKINRPLDLSEHAQSPPVSTSTAGTPPSAASANETSAPAPTRGPISRNPVFGWFSRHILRAFTAATLESVPATRGVPGADYEPAPALVEKSPSAGTRLPDDTPDLPGGPSTTLPATPTAPALTTTAAPPQPIGSPTGGLAPMPADAGGLGAMQGTGAAPTAGASPRWPRFVESLLGHLQNALGPRPVVVGGGNAPIPAPAPMQSGSIPPKRTSPATVADLTPPKVHPSNVTVPAKPGGAGKSTPSPRTPVRRIVSSSSPEAVQPTQTVFTVKSPAS